MAMAREGKHSHFDCIPQSFFLPSCEQQLGIWPAPKVIQALVLRTLYYSPCTLYCGPCTIYLGPVRCSLTCSLFSKQIPTLREVKQRLRQQIPNLIIINSNEAKQGLIKLLNMAET